MNAEEDLTQRKMQCENGTEILEDATAGLKDEEPFGQQKLDKARNRFSPRTSKGSVVQCTPWFQPNKTDFGLLSSRAVRE